MVVLMHKRRGGEEGVYHCGVPDEEGNLQNTYIGVYRKGMGEWYMHTSSYVV